jgi:folate-binding protein YgfZ
LLTNDVLSLAPGSGAYAAYLTPQGRMITDLRVHRLGDRLLAQVPAELAAGLALRFDQLIFAEDARVSDVSGSLAQWTVVGGRASAWVAHALDQSGAVARLDALPPLAHLELGAAVVARADDVALPCFDVFMELAACEAAKSRLRAEGIETMPAGLFEALRIEAGRPRFGVDMTTDTIPLEAGLLERGISTTKGCYVGQEIVIRILHRGGGRVAKRLVTLRIERADSVPPAGAELLLAGQPVGRVTSAADSPSRGGIVALGYVAREHAEIGRHLSLGNDLTAEIAGFAA